MAHHGPEMVVAEDDLAMVMPVLPEDGLVMVVAPAIPQLGDMTTPRAARRWRQWDVVFYHNWRGHVAQLWDRRRHHRCEVIVRHHHHCEAIFMHDRHDHR